MTAGSNGSGSEFHHNQASSGKYSNIIGATD
jgi:hypothetical protein